MTYVTESMRRILSDYVLSVVLEAPGVKVFRLGPDKATGMGVVRLIFTEKPLTEQIIISGDLHPGNGNGVLSNPGYGIDWFGRRLGEGYLCEKFLRVEYVPAKAREALEDVKADHDAGERDFTEEQIDALDEALAASIEPGDDSNPVRHHEAFYDVWCKIFATGPDLRGFDYEPQTAGWLCAIQQRFAELYQKMEKNRRVE